MATAAVGTQMFFNDGMLPLDSTSQVEHFADLNDTTKVTNPYKGKLVHVKDTGTIYVCTHAERNMTTFKIESAWAPLFNDQGTALYITSNTEGGQDVFKITATRDPDGNRAGGTPRLVVTYPAF